MEINKIAEQWQAALIDRPDFLKQALQNFMQRAMQEEFQKFIGADEYQRTSERKGCRKRHLRKAVEYSSRQSVDKRMQRP